ncbi:protease pro-enzyme activation domain-containing protein [Streptacidiphilus sp. P02-A3a]|uniref:S53 family peptidase n=1 Tax=Streptacidiphilus sp. P02-A3a TaxID=2704468 RepID=UPI0015FB2F82|nr:S53 family peptidase [Streptacidiphilus sp. P02-A3a]QMU69431.1 S8/S53 family peptidase [Streptacidiphilus sp. P02-A3a]
MAAGTVALASPSQAAAPAPAVRALAGTHPDWAAPSADKGATPANDQITARVYLAGRDPAGLAAYAKAVSSPGSGAYGQFLKPARVRQLFGATAKQIADVRAWAGHAGLTVVGSDPHYLDVHGSAAAVDRAFGTRLHEYAVRGKLLKAPDSNAVVPAAVASAILGVTGLSDTAPTMRAQATPVGNSALGAVPETAGKPKPGLPTVATCSNYWGQKQVSGAPKGYTAKTSFDQCSYTPAQLRKAYGVTASGLTGKGATVAIVDAYGSSTMLADANKFAVNHGDKAFRKGQYSEVVTPKLWTQTGANDGCGGGPAGWAGEESLDVEMVHGLAPDADVVYVGANSCSDQDLMAALSTIVDKHLADVVSSSWSGLMHTTAGDEAPATVAAYEQIFEQGAAEGIGFDFAAGDCGNESPAAAATGANCDSTSTEAQTGFPSADPWVTDVGGTALGIKDASGGYGFETDMGTLRSALSADGKSWTPFPGTFYFGGGGGTSQDFAEPWYQGPVVPGKLAHTLMTGAASKTAQRVTPDVAMNGDLYTSVLVGMSDGSPYSEGGYGGTSVAAPEFSGIQADAIQARHGRAIGFANPSIYERANSADFHDVVNNTLGKGQQPLNSVADFGVISGSLKVRLVAFGRDFGLAATKGYDDATGVGSPDAAYLESFR